MWFPLTLLCISCALVASAQVVQVTVSASPPPGTVTPDTVYYGKDRPLKWSDFTGRVREQSASSALSFSGFSYDADVSVKSDTIHIHLYLQTYFVRSGSWVRTGAASAYALSHEQIHFQIAKIAEMGFRDRVLHDTLTAAFYPMEIKMLFLDYWRKMSAMQERFDNDTEHGTNHAQEAVWQKKVIKKLLSDSGPD